MRRFPGVFLVLLAAAAGYFVAAMTLEHVLDVHGSQQRLAAAAVGLWIAALTVRDVQGWER